LSKLVYASTKRNIFTRGILFKRNTFTREILLKKNTFTREILFKRNTFTREILYKRNTFTRGILFKRNRNVSLKTYTDVDYASSIVDGRLTIGYCTFLGENLITWKSKKQSVVARSNAKAEF